MNTFVGTEVVRDEVEIIKSKRIVVVGDYFLDRYVYIDNSKTGISIYTGAPAYEIGKNVCSPGAAGTIAKNLAVLGAGKVYAVGICGNDGEGFVLRKKMSELNIDIENLIITDELDTPSYTMIMQEKNGRYEEVAEIANQNYVSMSKKLEGELIGRMNALVENVKPDAVIFLDQLNHKECGVITKNMKMIITEIKKKYPEVLVLADSRKYIDEISTDIVRKCNDIEFCDTYGVSHDMISSKCTELSLKSKASFIVTLGAKGTLIANKEKLFFVPAFKICGNLDTRGAGDAFTTGYIVSMLCNGNEWLAGIIGNAFAACCVSQIATTGYIEWKQVCEYIALDKAMAG